MWGIVSAVVSGIPLKKRLSLKVPFGAALAAAVVGDDDDQRVLELPGVLEVVDHPPELVVGVGDVAGEHLGHAPEEALLVGAQRVPGRTVLSIGQGCPPPPVALGSPCGLIGESSVSSGSRPSFFWRSRISLRIAS